MDQIVSLLWKPFYDLHALFTVIISVSNPSPRRETILYSLLFCISSIIQTLFLMRCQESHSLLLLPSLEWMMIFIILQLTSPKWCLSESIKNMITITRWRDREMRILMLNIPVGGFSGTQTDDQMGKNIWRFTVYTCDGRCRFLLRCTQWSPTTRIAMLIGKLWLAWKERWCVWNDQ